MKRPARRRHSRTARPRKRHPAARRPRKIRHARHARHKRRRIRHARSKHVPGVLRTEIDDIVDYVNERGPASVQQVAVFVGLSPDQVEQWAIRLHDKHLLQLHYPVVGHPQLRPLVERSVPAKRGTRSRSRMILAAVIIAFIAIFAFILWRRFGGP